VIDKQASYVPYCEVVYLLVTKDDFAKAAEAKKVLDP
jgi:hypothetical protein